MKKDFITDINSFPTKEEAIKYYYDYYRENGFPNYDPDDYDPFNEMTKLIQFDEKSMVKDGEIGQVMTGCGFLFSLFPHWASVSVEGSKSVLDSWNDDKTFRDLIRKTVDYNIKHSNSKWTTNRIRQNAKVYGSKSSVSNFRPTAAKYLYNTYGHKGAVYDPCGGWGGRLMGFLASNCQEYVCCDPSTETFKGLNRVKDIYKYRNKDVSINCIGAEDYVPEKEHFDFVFTSPPYFNTEHYSDEDTQSWKRFPKYDQWVEGFLRPMLQHSYDCLKLDRYCMINIANTKTGKTLEEDTVRVAKEIGFNHEGELKLILSSIAGKGIKYEPIFIFKKA